MKKNLRTLLSLISVLIPVYLWADQVDFRVESKSKKTSFMMGTEVSSLQTTSGNLNGYGARLGFGYHLSPKWMAQLCVSQILQFGGTKYLYTGFNAAAKYNLSGQNRIQDTLVTKSAVPVVDVKANRESVFSIGLGPEQLLVNGSEQIYPATGLSLSASYQFKKFDYWLSSEFRFGSFTANSRAITAAFFNLSILFDL